MLKRTVKRTPVIRDVARWVIKRLPFGVSGREPPQFSSSREYWDARYSDGGNSGVGSYSQFADFKAKILNAVVRQFDVESVIEFGCGDGNQLRLVSYPSYIGFDVSRTAIDTCRKLFAGDGSKVFRLLEDYAGEQADASLSLDVIYHLVEDKSYIDHMQSLFTSARKVVVIYSSNVDADQTTAEPHIRHRNFTDWIERYAPDWVLSDHIANPFPYCGDHRKGSWADFYIYGKSGER